MTVAKIQVDIVSAEQKIFSGTADALIISGEVGELGIFPGHTPLLTPLKPGEIILQQGDREDVFYVSGGILEVQPHLATILADTVARADELDEIAAQEAKERAESAMRDSKAQLEYAVALQELAQAMAQLKAIQRLKK